MIEKVLYVRSGPYKPNINSYNMQEIGFAKSLLKRGISTDIVYYSDETKTDIFIEKGNNQIRILWEKGYKILRTGYYPQLISKDFLNSYDLVIVTEFSQIMTYLVSKYSSKCVLYSGPYYNLFKLPFIEPIYDLLFTKKINTQIRKIYAKSELAKIYLENKGYSNVTTLGVGLDAEKFINANPPQKETTDILNYMNNNRCLLYVGTICDRKNFPFLLEVFSHLKTKYNSSLKLVIIGSGKEKYIKKCYKKLDTNIAKDIVHIGNIDNDQLKYIYSTSEMFILPSKLEIFGMVLLEAMYFNNCVFTTVNGGSKTVINNNNGIIFDKFDIDMWAKKIYEMECDKVKLKNICENAGLTVKQHYLWDSIVSKFLDNLPEDFD